MSEEITYASVKFSRTPAVCTNDVVTNKAPQRWPSILYILAVGVGILIALLVIVVIIQVVWRTAPQRWPSILCILAVGVGILIALLVIVVIIQVVWRTDSTCPGCPDQWLGYRSSCYFFSKMKKDWSSSQDSCSAEGSHLLVISDASKMDLFKQMYTDTYWIGLRNKNGTAWTWEDGSKLNNTKDPSHKTFLQQEVLTFYQ
nr:killer cell lectin-like receptor subfamily G member 1 [Pelodiscus sinensis]|eukprot:XP_006116460.1 killer cell lectin-like receptor subfamily G member 1 [Pelodiscus sinensis]